MEEVVGAWMVPSRQPASFLSTPQSPMAPWSRSPWRTARWCGRRGGSFSDSECALGQGGGWAREISPGTPQSFLSSLGTVRSQDPCWPQPRGPITLWGWSVGRLLAGGSPGRPPTLGKQSHMSTEKDADKCSSSGGNFFSLAVLFQVEGCQPFYSVLGS